MTPTSRELFAAAAAGKDTPRPPVWVMRQAGRFLPEYRKLKQKYTFTQIVKTPELAVEASLQPIRRFGFDCAIIFADILTVAEALGFPYDFAETGGIRLQKTVKTERDVELLEARAESVCGRLEYVAQALCALRRELPDKAVYGFCGSPWTLACYMLQGCNSAGFEKIFHFKKERPDLFERCMRAIETASVKYAQMQLGAGIDAFQVFDSHAGLTPQGAYQDFSGRWARGVIAAVKGKAAAVLFANGMSQRFAEAADMGADFYSLDSSVKLSEIRQKYGVGVQGNLAPETLSADAPEAVARKTRAIIDDMRGGRRHIFNLGHGIRPDAKLENVEAMCQAVFESK